MLHGVPGGVSGVRQPRQNAAVKESGDPASPRLSGKPVEIGVLRLGKPMIGAVVLAFACALAAPAAEAQTTVPFGYSVRERGRPEAAPGQRAARQGDDRRQSLQREPQRQQRLSPEERQQLRRDIKDAGRELYPRKR